VKVCAKIWRAINWPH